MNDSAVLLTSIAAELALVLLHFLWQGTLIAGTTWIVLRIARRTRPTTRYVVVLLGTALCALAPIATFIELKWQGREVEFAAVTATSSNVVPATATPVNETIPSVPVWRQVLVAAWLLGVCLMAARLIIGWYTVHRLRRRAAPAENDILDLVASYAVRLRMRRRPRIAVSSRIAEAMVVGLFRPMILLPAAWLTELPPDVLGAVIAHELAHVRRLDPWVNAVQRIVETLLFYHPAVWWLSRRMRIEREFCCDELAVRITGQPLVYVRTLELVAHRRLDQRIPALATGIGDGKMTLLQRVQQVLGGREDRPRSLLTPLAAALVVLLGFALYRMACSTPTALLADDEPRRGREVERSRRGDEAGVMRRRERQTEIRRERSDRDADEGERERRDDMRESRIRDEELSPEVRELIGSLRAQINELEARLRERGAEGHIEAEVRDVDGDGVPDTVLHRRLTVIHRGEGPRDGAARERALERERGDRDAAGEVRSRELRQGDVEWRVAGIPIEGRDREFRAIREEPAERREEHGDDRAGQREDHPEHESVRMPRVRVLRDGENDLQILVQDEESEGEHREGHAEQRPERESEMKPRVRVFEAAPPEHREGLEAEVRELRQQVRDLSQIVGDLRNAIRDRDENEDDEAHEGQDREAQRLRQRRLRERALEDEQTDERVRDQRLQLNVEQERLRNLTDRAREDEAAGRRDRDEEGEAEGAGEDEPNGEARIESDNGRQTTLQSTGDGRVRIWVRESDGNESILESDAFELNEGNHVLNAASSSDGTVRVWMKRGDQNSVLDARVIRLNEGGRIQLEGVPLLNSAPSNPQETGDRLDPFAADESDDREPPAAGGTDSTDPFAGGEALDRTETAPGDQADVTADPFASDEAGDAADSTDTAE